jgi:ornithine cyclodeaminase/alanine dehydrogenase-like protein (mu-crystallin family)
LLYLTEAEVAELISVDEVIPLVESALAAEAQGRVVNNPRRRLALDAALLMSLEAGDLNANFAGHKNYLAVPGKGVLAHFFLYKSDTRELLAMVQANELGRIRTGATGGVAAKYLARADATRHAVFGAGFQAETQVEAISCVRSISEVRVWSRTEQHAREFQERMRTRLPGVQISLALDDPAELAAWGDIVTIATRASEPVVRGAWLRSGVFVNAMGSNATTRAEIDTEVVRLADLIVADSLEGARAESGDLIQAAEQGALDWERVRSLSAVVAGLAPGRRRDNEICLFESQGLGLEDLAAGRFAYERARELGVGRHFDIGDIGSASA